MTQEEIKKENVEALRSLLSELKECGANEDSSVFLADHGVEFRHQARWVKDQTKTGTQKDIYVCSHCNHWVSVNKKRPDNILYKHYCDFCGCKMYVKENL